MLVALAVAFVVGGSLFLGQDQASADQAYHTERVEWVAQNAHPDLRSGQVVNIHPDGPLNGAHERYMVNGADADETYQVVIVLFDACGGEILGVAAETALLTTDARGNGQSRAAFSRDALDTFGPPFPVVLDVAWQLRVGSTAGEVAYQTACTTVTIDGPHAPGSP